MFVKSVCVVIDSRVKEFRNGSYITDFKFVHSLTISLVSASKNPMIQVTLCEQALIKTNKNTIQNHQSKTMFLFKHTHLNLSLTDILSTWLAIRECRVGFLCLL